MIHKALTIAGFDGSGGAGIQADLKTFSALKCYGTSVLTALPIQNTQGVKEVYDIAPFCVEDQIKAILNDIPVNAIKVGMLHRQEIIEVVSKLLCHYAAKNIVLDPVMVAKSGDLLLQSDAITTMKKKLFPITTILTPNLSEASALLEREVKTHTQMEKAALELLAMGPQAVVVKGGHLNNNCDDCLALKTPHIKLHWFSTPKIQTRNTHGTGCTFSAAIAAYLARGFPIFEAVGHAKRYLTTSIQAGAHVKWGQGHGPIHHFHHLWN
jgi:hydroxymethylpyrimidine/phosphomethylpyrimidine kinase